MGGGHSRMGMVYPRKWKAKAEKRKAPEFHALGYKSEKARNRARKSDDLKDGSARSHQQSSSSSSATAAVCNWSANGDHKCSNEGVLATNTRSMDVSGPILAQAELSCSQVDFFRMLDEKIALGKDYNSSEEDEASGTSVDGSDTKPEVWGQHQWNEMLQYQQQMQEQAMQQQQRPHRTPHYPTPPSEAIRNDISAANPSEIEWDIQLTENNGSVSENGERQDRPVRPGRTVAPDPDSVSRHHKSVKPNSGNKSWFSETYSAWPLRRIGAALREDRSNTGNVVKIGARNPTEVGRQRKTVI